MYSADLSWVLSVVAITLTALTAFAVNASRRTPRSVPATDSQ
jgi:hypothetical protein